MPNIQEVTGADLPHLLTLVVPGHDRARVGLPARTQHNRSHPHTAEGKRTEPEGESGKLGVIVASGGQKGGHESGVERSTGAQSRCRVVQSRIKHQRRADVVSGRTKGEVNVSHDNTQQGSRRGGNSPIPVRGKHHVKVVNCDTLIVAEQQQARMHTVETNTNQTRKSSEPTVAETAQ